MLNDENAQDPMGSMRETAISQHEMYMSWLAAGFTAEQALELLKTVVAEIIRGAV